MLKLLKLYCVLTIIIISQDVYARHKCPKVPAPPGLMGFISSSTFIPSGSTMAAARSSQTFGCDQGHPSENFYKPKKKRVSIFLRENLQQIKMECAQGRGDHLIALMNLAGCNGSQYKFSRLLRDNYAQIFEFKLNEIHYKSNVRLRLETSERIINLIFNSPKLGSSCKSS